MPEWVINGRLKSWLRPMRGLKTDRTESVVIRGHAFIQILRRGHYALGTESGHESALSVHHLNPESGERVPAGHPECSRDRRYLSYSWDEE